MADNKAKALEFKAQGNGFLKQQKFPEAIECYTKAIELDPTNHVFYSNRSAAHLSMGNAEKALEDGDACITANPTWPKGYSRKGAALQSLKRFDDAIAAFKAGLAVDASNAMLQSGLEGAEAAKKKAAAPPRGPSLFGPETIARLALNPKFRGYMEDPTFMAKLQMLQSNPSALGAMQTDPRIMEVLSFLLGIPMQGGPGGPGGAPGAPPAAAAASAPAPAPASAKEEEEEEEEVVELSAEELAAKEVKDKALAKKKEGNALYKKKDFDGALACYEEAYKIDPENVLILNNQAAVHFARKNYEKCVEVCNVAMERATEVMASFNDKAKILARLGNAKVKLGDLAGALEAYDSSLMEHHTDDVYTRRRKIVKLKKKRDAEAYFDEDKAEEAKERGNEAFRAGDWRTAIKEYTEATKRNPNNPKYYQNRASALMKVIDYVGALSDANQAIKVDPKYVKGYYRKGLVQMCMKDYHKAITTFQQGLAIDDTDAGCLDGLRQVQGRLNREAASGEVDPQRAARAMQDPEIQAIMRDPIVRQVLSEQNPARLREALNDPSMSHKLMRLRQAGILQMR